MGSVKDLAILKKPSASEAGIGNFTFSDRYSVFDWGEMPNHITNKGSALCLIGAYFFEKLEGMSIKSHYLGLVENGETKRLSELSGPANTMQVSLVQVFKPTEKDGSYDYSNYSSSLTNFLVPLEIIYRNALPPGSSVFKRLKDGSLKLESIGLDSMPSPGEKLDPPILDVSTKLEATDRYMTWEEAQSISALSDEELATLKTATLKINQLITDEAGKMGLIHEDGKIEFGMNANRGLVLLDVLGTPDECRFTYKDIPVSKEAARVYYRTTPWFSEIEKAKKQDRSNWKQMVSSPPPLPEKFDKLVSQLYMAFCNDLTGRKWFDTPTLKEVLAEMDDYLKEIL